MSPRPTPKCSGARHGFLPRSPRPLWRHTLLQALATPRCPSSPPPLPPPAAVYPKYSLPGHPPQGNHDKRGFSFTASLPLLPRPQRRPPSSDRPPPQALLQGAHALVLPAWPPRPGHLAPPPRGARTAGAGPCPAAGKGRGVRPHFSPTKHRHGLPGSGTRRPRPEGICSCPARRPLPAAGRARAPALAHTAPSAKTGSHSVPSAPDRSLVTSSRLASSWPSPQSSPHFPGWRQSLGVVPGPPDSCWGASALLSKGQWHPGRTRGPGSPREDASCVPGMVLTRWFDSRLPGDYHVPTCHPQNSHSGQGGRWTQLKGPSPRPGAGGKALPCPLGLGRGGGAGREASETRHQQGSTGRWTQGPEGLGATRGAGGEAGGGLDHGRAAGRF